MSELGEVTISILDAEPQTKAPFTAEQIAAMHSRENVRYGILHTYTRGGNSVSVLFRSPDLDKLSNEEQTKVASFLSAREGGESYRYETLLVNSLMKQLQIAQRFGLTDESVYRNLNLDASDKAMILLDDWGTLYLRVLDESVQSLRQHG
jgi:hypothetical protein